MPLFVLLVALTALLTVPLAVGLTVLLTVSLTVPLTVLLPQPVDDEKKTKDLQFHQSIYWAAVTLTTVGYGDIVPTYWATQVMLIGLLMLTFTLLPYLTGNLMSALTSTSTYQRRRWAPLFRKERCNASSVGQLTSGPTRTAGS